MALNEDKCELLIVSFYSIRSWSQYSSVQSKVLAALSADCYRSLC